MDKKVVKGIGAEKKAEKIAAKQAKKKRNKRILWGVIAFLLGIGLIGTSILWGLGAFDSNDYEKEEETADTAQAVSDAEAALAADPENISLMKDLGEAYLNNGQFEEALEQYLKVTEASPTDIDAWLNQAVAQSYTGDYEASRASFEKAIEVNPDYPVSYYYYGYYLGFGMGEYEEGIEQLQKYKEVAGEGADTSSVDSLIESMQAIIDNNEADASGEAAEEDAADAEQSEDAK